MWMKGSEEEIKPLMAPSNVEFTVKFSKSLLLSCAFLSFPLVLLHLVSCLHIAERKAYSFYETK